MFGFGKKSGGSNLPGPKEIPELVGRFLVTDLKQDPDRVWRLKGVVRPVDKKRFYCRVFDASRVGFKVADWTSFDEHPELVLWEVFFDRETNTARLEKFEKNQVKA